MLDTFITWAQRVQSHTAGPSLKIQLTGNEEPENPSARLDFDSPFAIARITFWNSGDYDAEVSARETGRTIYSGFGLIDEGRDLSHLFAPVFRALRVDLP
ncbi:hypothetical protein GCM10023165_32490 [Variovorax defluvii]|uniref:Uncharacterized protein n=1 Tax=Variovorax defluvii TaxID=913761 RepID=A0ABP8HYQ0_9BURK